jgi:hypothetical protein
MVRRLAPFFLLFLVPNAVVKTVGEGGGPRISVCVWDDQIVRPPLVVFDHP